MSRFDLVRPVFRAAPIVDKQIFIAAEKPEIPPTYRLIDLGGLWLAADQALPVVAFRDAAGRLVGYAAGHVHSEFHGEFLREGEVSLPETIADVSDVELKLMPRLAGSFVLLTTGDLPRRLYMDHGASFPMVYSPGDKRAASSAAILLDEPDYRARFREDFHEVMISKEGTGSWIPGELTAHQGVSRIIANHYLDLESWTSSRYWPRPGQFAQWRDFKDAVDVSSKAIGAFTSAVSRGYSPAVTLTAGMDSRALVASCVDVLDKVEFFTLDTGGMDVDVSQKIARTFGLRHRVTPLRHVSEEAGAVWDRMVGDCTMEVTRATHTTLAELTDRDVVLAGLFGETARCRLYRQDYQTINSGVIDPAFVADRLTIPQHPEVLAYLRGWLDGLEGQPNSVIMEMAFVELKVGVWAMGQRSITNSVKLNLYPFCQRPVLEAFVGVSPLEKGTEALFKAVIVRLWPELMQLPINKYGDARDQLTVFKKLSDLNKVRRYLRDRFARKRTVAAS